MKIEISKEEKKKAIKDIREYFQKKEMKI